ncbi:DUF2515 family protein [Peribacillus sp. SCS-155]|uniref:DUF2515 family protein n=1 Tax=Peribacillus sedimenti TaxID=3115297 RepID=UPI0039060891
MEEKHIIITIKDETAFWNRDNISRTKAYERFFKLHPEIMWAFLAGMVSRNAGWNMCDLEGDWMPKLMGKDFRQRLFLTYERANWLIFQDAYPQLLLYHYSTKFRKTLFHLNKYFSVTNFMVCEWKKFWEARDKQRLLYSLIINEQNLIEEPVLHNNFYKEQVFESLLFRLQDHLHFSTVLFPTKNGDLYGISASRFKNLGDRITLGKKLALILFSPELFPSFCKFAAETEPTGSRYDYERYFPCYKRRDTPFLRLTYPFVNHPAPSSGQWDLIREIKPEWFSVPECPKNTLLNSWHRKKQIQLQASIRAAQWIKGVLR